jgi:uncharacterized protein YndB with AHSA1/START domain
MPTAISPYHVRRVVWIDAPPDVVWEEFTTFERMQAWYGTGHTLTEYEPRVGGIVETAVSIDRDHHRFRGEILAFEPGAELTFEQLWIGSDWEGPAMVTIRLTPVDDGTLVELFHHGFEALGADAAENHRGFEGGWTMRQLDALHELIGN